jgi:hypothetical protein
MKLYKRFLFWNVSSFVINSVLGILFPSHWFIAIHFMFLAGLLLGFIVVKAP